MADKQAKPNQEALSSVFTTSFSNILAELGVSLVVSTYQAGQVVLVRYDPNGPEGRGVVNTHFRSSWAGLRLMGRV